MQITPSPRILSMLGEIEIADWQCLAELIDNSIDEIQKRNDKQVLNCNEVDTLSQIEVLLPSPKTELSNAEIEVRDRGRGMSEDQLRKSVRAGWTGNDPFEHLGLFGMGFNVATARLGRVTEVITTTAGELKWRGVRIDLDKIGEDFSVPEFTLPKSDPGAHGTRVRITRLDPSRYQFMTGRAEVIRTRLGEVYSWLLESTPVNLRVNGKVVRPRAHCVWDRSRYVNYGKGRNHEQIPAIIKVEKQLSDAQACTMCGHWQSLGQYKCERCNSTSLKLRARRIHGWVGIQRYLDSNNYGIDFIRNGRKILVHDKSVFEWKDPNDSIVGQHEYPIEIPATKGRIVGEIHLDHVPVDYKKDRFETSSRDWIYAINYLRGEGPLRPQAAKRAGYDQNDSPIGRLFRGYQRNDPGRKCLIPGDGKNATHWQAAEWGQMFHRGDARYQTDEKWWMAVLHHEAEVARKNAPAPESSGSSDEDAILRALGDPTSTISDGTTGIVHGVDSDAETIGDGLAARPISLSEQVEALHKGAKAETNLSREYRINAISDYLNVTAWVVGEPIKMKENARSSPVYLYPTGGGDAELFIDVTHELFRTQGAEALDVAVAEVAYFLGVRRSVIGNGYSISQLVAELRRDTFKDANLDFTTVQESTRSVIDQIRMLVAVHVDADPQRAWMLLSTQDISRLETKYASRGQVLCSTNSDFVSDVPALYLVRLLEEWPEVFTDGAVFEDRYTHLASDEAKQVVKAQLMSLLLDCASVASEEKGIASLNILKRARLSLEMLEQKIVQA
ncbi:ATP-binding protein [Hoyosella sp. G463]|uniref:ATP-binding protein n=1 Tax=Lolliginicoccus lacisalsi TaxID=2742202 RepID=A0A927PJU9_9ACTN|nr:ATP-binding protein [Lolliginicoccus lacisalsi]MBD8504963.1 ATP-binding protein [Lolliginicoccus lacisalsi]